MFPGKKHMTERQQNAPEQKNKEARSNQGFIVLSENGFGGQKYRLVKRYLKTAGEIEKFWEATQDDGVFITRLNRQNSKGSLSTVTARKGRQKARSAVFLPSNKQDFEQYLKARKPIKDKVSPTDFTTIQMPPTEYALSMLMKKITVEKIALTPAERMKQLLTETSFFPLQNPDLVWKAIDECIASNRPLKIGCFVCLNIPLENVNGRPRDQVKATFENTRLTEPRIQKRTVELLNLLDRTGLLYQIYFLIADTDAYDIYGGWLADNPETVESKTELFTAQATQNLTRLSPNISVARWSTIQTTSESEYRENFSLAYENAAALAGKDVLDLSISRRQKYFAQKGFPETTPERIARWDDAARRNIALYAAQGPIIKRTFDCLIIADPNPIKLGKNQSLLCPDLPIWYPYPG